MQSKRDIVDQLLKGRSKTPAQSIVSAYAPSNIALCKYWGKRDEALNLPVTSSLSVSLANKGTTTVIKCIEAEQDKILLNDKVIDLASQFGKRITNYLNLFRQNNETFLIKTSSNIPVAAGFASSASGFAALIEALNLLYDWQLDGSSLSILARLGSGSACRSLWHGFVEWRVGERNDGMDCNAVPIKKKWHDLCVGLLVLSAEEKAISSRKAMRQSKKTSCYYDAWPEKVSTDIKKLHQAINEKNFELLGSTAESNALAMHATMLTALPPICYWQPETITAMHEVWMLRREGIPVYFTEDAGPNLKLLFEVKDAKLIMSHFPSIEVVMPFQEEYK